MSSLPSPLTSPTAAISAPGANHSCHFCPAPKLLPFDSATYTSPVLLWAKVMMSSRPSPLTSPVVAVSPPMEKKSFHFTEVPAKPVPVEVLT